MTLTGCVAAGQSANTYMQNYRNYVNIELTVVLLLFQMECIETLFFESRVTASSSAF